MNRKDLQILRKFLSLAFAMVMILSTNIVAIAKSRAMVPTLRIAFPIQPGLTDVAEDGMLSGYIYEYLQEIAQYTGWRYEFVLMEGGQNEQLMSSLEMLEKGEVDLIGGMLYSNGLAEQFEYAQLNMGNRETVLQVLANLPQEIVINPYIHQTMRVAALEGGTRVKQDLEAFAVANKITVEYIDCHSNEEMLEALHDNRADALLNINITQLEGVRTIAKFNPAPFYFVTTKGDPKNILLDLNQTLLNIEQIDPNFRNSIFEKYFTSYYGEITFSDRERAFIESASPFKIGVLLDASINKKEDSDMHVLAGVAQDVLKYITEKSGLEFETVYVDDIEELLEMSVTGKVDLIAGMPYHYGLAQEYAISMTRPYLSSPLVSVSQEREIHLLVAEKKAMVRGGEGYWDQMIEEVVYFSTFQECMNAVESGAVQSAVTSGLVAQYFANMPQYKSMQIIPYGQEMEKLCFGVANFETELLTILNKCILNISNDQLQTIISNNVLRTPEITLEYFVHRYPIGTLLSVSTLSFCFILLLLVILCQRTKMAKKTVMELDKRMRVYSLERDYFFEYDYGKDFLVVSNPLQQTENQEENSGKLNFESERRLVFLQHVREIANGIAEIHILCEDEKWHWLRIAVETTFHPKGHPRYCVGKINVIDDEKNEKQLLTEQAQKDSLTSVYNAASGKRLVQESLEQLTEETHGGLLLLDLDHFKDVNDTYGHLNGDRVLLQVATALQNALLSGDFVARMGGDEFLIHFYQIRSTTELADRCNGILKKMQKLTVGDEIHVTVSCGAIMTQAGDQYETIYEMADQALYLAKDAGRDRVEIVHREKIALCSFSL